MKTLLRGVGLWALVWLGALTTPAQTNQNPAAAAQQNAMALRQYEWKMRTEVQRKGETKSVQVASVRFDSNGQKQTTLISKTPEPDLPKFGLRKAIAEKKFKEFKETIQGLGELARAYGELSPEQMQRFMASATVTPEVTAQGKLVRAEGSNVLRAGDSMTVWMDAASRRQRRVEIKTLFDEKVVWIVSEFQDLPQGGPTFMALSRVNYDGGEVVIVTENSDHQRVRQQTAAAVVKDEGWPRQINAGGSSFAVYQPQMEEWAGNRWLARAAFSVTNGPSGQPNYGVLWFEARTDVDKVKRLVTFTEIKITKLNFPSAPEKTSIYQSALQSHVSQKGEAIALDRVLTDMATNHVASTPTGFGVKNDPPKIFFSTAPALLVLIDGAPVLRPVEGTELQRVINTRVLILNDRRTGKFYLRLLDGWLETNDIMAQWQLAKSVAEQLSGQLNKALANAAASKQVDLLSGPAAEAGTTKPSLKDLARQNELPAIYVSTVPAELLQTRGEPQVAAVPNTELVYVTNTENDIFVHTATQDHYILVAGRWFGSQSMKGPWTYVAPDKLPADFARIPESHAKASVLVSVAGTPQAKEAMIANSIPQTATVPRNTTALTVDYDGAPEFKPVENTSLQYAVNTSTPVIAVSSNTYYAVYNGVWFVGAAPRGPWVVAATVPNVIYSIPVSSPLHYVTYVRVYGSTPEVVYVGYTPGYYGTVVTSSNVVVYGTGWYVTGGGGVAYNPNTNTGVAVHNNNVYADRNGNIYRYVRRAVKIRQIRVLTACGSVT